LAVRAALSPTATGVTSMAVQQNTDHIQTTHIGSLPRPHKLLDILKAKYSGQHYDVQVRRNGLALCFDASTFVRCTRNELTM
jgi:hypothetical protein